MVRFPNSKINLGLHILGKRNDGYHNLETVFYPLGVKDALEVQTAPSNQATTLTITGLPVSGNQQSNLCYKAWQLLKTDFTLLPNVNIHLHKAIPMGAGLGGGSADGAFMLLMLNEKYNLALSEEKLINYALQLGSDCPFFIKNIPCFATGRGEELEPVSVPLMDYYFYIVNPNIHINTAEAFAALQYTLHQTSIEEIIKLPVTEWKDNLVNDFEMGIAQKHTEIAAVKQSLYNNGAVYAAMTGSGSTVFGIYTSVPNKITFPPHFFTAIVTA